MCASRVRSFQSLLIPTTRIRGLNRRLGYSSLCGAAVGGWVCLISRQLTARVLCSPLVRFINTRRLYFQVALHVYNVNDIRSKHCFASVQLFANYFRGSVVAVSVPYS